MKKNTSATKKETPTKFQILPEIKNRWSPRAFDDMPISDNELKKLFEAGRWAPSSNNFQPWAIIYGIKGTEMYDRIFDCLVEFNQGWAKNAPALVLSAFKKTNPKGEENFHALHDLGQYMANVAIQAQHNGIALHQMAGIDYEKAKKEFNFPDDFHVATATAIGYYGGDISSLPDDLQDAERGERKRKEQSSFVFNGDFNEEKFNQ
ncbi:nitroreductase [Dokdonia sinensis]|uniref:Nitroreductase n=1 Tax=Dokdonia sinensis TaxID=2479847 RepID=A0A3M0FXT5_9FLAO|nr:nitroreductase family protein [Dokdonia sinensis]RMB57325.1 nitroreductase [Dokdonia sinensis]